MNLSSIRRTSRAGPVTETAARWALRQEKGELSPAEQRDLEIWLAADPAHATAYDDIIWALDTTARHAGEPELLALRKEALAARGERRRGGWLLGGLGGAIAASFGIMWLWTVSPDAAPPQATFRGEQPADPNRAEHATAVGERLAVTLPDSSVVTLDTDSKVRVVYSKRERNVQLLRGQALFEVAHGNARPFQVHAGGQQITAVGTVFNVRLDQGAVKVALLEGVVHVRPQPASAARAHAPTRDIVMRAGEAAELRPSKVAIVRPADVSQVASWQSGDLVFNDTRLAEAVAEINRYATRPIAIADSSIADYRISGVFRSNDPERFSQAMRNILPVQVDHSANGAPVLRARN